MTADNEPVWGLIGPPAYEIIQFADDRGETCSVVKITKSVVCKTATREDAEDLIVALARGSDR